ncbi:MAG: DUF5134 domain-containing protein [Actinocrinis sp.]
MSDVPSFAAWCCTVVLFALAVRSAARLLSDRTPAGPAVPGCSLTSRGGDAIHLATSVGMAVMVVPAALAPAAAMAVGLLALFSATTAYVLGAWLIRVSRRRLTARRGGVMPCRPAHALEPHHVLVGLAMIAMAARMTSPVTDRGPGTGSSSGSSTGSSMAGMPGMADGSSGTLWLTLGTLSLLYVWAAALYLGAGLAKAVVAQPAPNGAAAILAAPVTVYACEVAMTVVMGLMLLG